MALDSTLSGTPGRVTYSDLSREDRMNRRTFIVGGLGAALSSPLLAALRQEKFEAAAEVLSKAAASGQVAGSSLCVRHGKEEFARAFGTAPSPDAMFLLASVTKTLSAAAVMTLVDREKLRLEDPVLKVIPEFSTESRK